MDTQNVVDNDEPNWTEIEQERDAWFKVAVGNTLQGKLIERFTSKDKNGNEKFSYRILLQKPTLATAKKKDFTVYAGSVICIDEKKPLTGLRRCVGYNVWIRVLPQIDINIAGTPGKMWQFKLKSDAPPF